MEPKMKKNILALALFGGLIPRLYCAQYSEYKGPEASAPVLSAPEIAAGFDALPLGESTSLHLDSLSRQPLGLLVGKSALKPESQAAASAHLETRVSNLLPAAASISKLESFISQNISAPETSALSGRAVLKKASAIAAALSSRFLLAANGYSGPAQVIIIRHGEKPPVGNHLNDRGRARAQALVGFFKNNPEVTQYGAPAAIYAMKPSSDDGSFRPIETVTPLSQSLGLSIIEDYAKKDGLAMIQAILSNASYAGKMVLICWEHHDIVNLVRYFGWDSGPDSWKGDVFDRAWILNFENRKLVSFKDVPQRLLPGDSSQ
jgi:hypothetical protein